jgi:hypothetical protein
MLHGMTGVLACIFGIVARLLHVMCETVLRHKGRNAHANERAKKNCTEQFCFHNVFPGKRDSEIIRRVVAARKLSER